MKCCYSNYHLNKQREIYGKNYNSLMYFDKNYTGPYPTQSPVSMEDLAVIYPKASGDSKADPERMSLSHKATVDLQNKCAGLYALWRHMLNVSVVSMKANFTALNVHFDI